MADGKVVHPGRFVRDHVIPTGVSVTAASKTLGVGRPTLSNFLNGKAGLSQDMAARLATAYGADKQKLLELQARYEEATTTKDVGVAVRSHVPNLVQIRAHQIDGWADRLAARQELPVLLRTLIHSTGRELRTVDFPGHDNAQRKGWDGEVNCEAPTPWIPGGLSGWEFGCNKKPEAKANHDYEARASSLPEAQRRDRTFVFVTPRNWPAKKDWARRKTDLGDWKSVRAYDADDLEQWLEQSLTAQVWMAERLDVPLDGIATIGRSWDSWARGSKPPMVREFFAPSVAAHEKTFDRWLGEEPDEPFIVAADSKGEALAFLACLLDTGRTQKSSDLAIEIKTAEAMRKLSTATLPFIAIVANDDAERGLTDLVKPHHVVVVRPRNSVDAEPNITLDLLNHEDFEKGLAAMNIIGDEADRLSRGCGRSPTILRRRLARLDAVRSPHWATDPSLARTLIPLAFVGAWHANSRADQEVLSQIGERSYSEIEEILARLLPLDDSPVWSLGQYRGVASKIDAIFAVSKFVTEHDLDSFFFGAEYVLSESDPALQLPESSRWAAGIYGKTRDHSEALRTGVCETLVILAIHGDNLFQNRLGVHIEARVSKLINDLLSPLSEEKLLSQQRDLPRYAEASPQAFLELIERDLATKDPVVRKLMKPVDSSGFGSPQRTGLLWALECLAWNPLNLARVIRILAQLSHTRIDDNWVNKPMESLGAIFRSWMPQTAATIEQRITALDTLVRTDPEIGWEICVHEFDLHSRVGHDSYRPRWRADASGAGQPISSWDQARPFMLRALELAIDWPNHNQETLADLVERLRGMPVEYQNRVWDAVDRWAKSDADDEAKATLRERIRRTTFTRRGWRNRERQENEGRDEASVNRARAAYEALASGDPVVRHGWLFLSPWVDESWDEINDDDMEFSERDRRINQLRERAIVEIWAEEGLGGLLRLATSSGAPAVIGQLAAACAEDNEARLHFVERFLTQEPGPTDEFLRGFLLALSDGERRTVLEGAIRGKTEDKATRLLICAPFDGQTWSLAASLGTEVSKSYWTKVSPFWNRHGEHDRSELVDRLLEVDRPNAAFAAVHLDFKEMETAQLMRLLRALVTGGSSEDQQRYRLESYYISEALDVLSSRPGMTEEEMAQLEFMFLGALDHSEHGIPNLERQVAKSPSLFAQLVGLVYRRKTPGEDPPEWQIDDADKAKGAASAAYRLLDRLGVIPGTDPDDGEIKLGKLIDWLDGVRQLFAKHGRAEVGDHAIGQLLSKAPADQDGSWPCEPVCDALENIASPDVASGFRIGAYNSRGVHYRGEGGDQEREIAVRYRRWGRQIAYTHPYVAGLLEAIARSYDADARHEDSRSKVRRRLEGY